MRNKPDVIDASTAEDVVRTFDHVTADSSSLSADSEVCDGCVVVLSAIFDLSKTSIVGHVHCESGKVIDRIIVGFDSVGVVHLFQVSLDFSVAMYDATNQPFQGRKAPGLIHR